MAIIRRIFASKNPKILRFCSELVATIRWLILFTMLVCQNRQKQKESRITCGISLELELYKIRFWKKIW